MMFRCKIAFGTENEAVLKTPRSFPFLGKILILGSCRIETTELLTNEAHEKKL